MLPDKYFNPEGLINKHGVKIPHWQQGDALQFVTFRLKDSLPQEKLREWTAEKKRWLQYHPKPWTSDVYEEYYRIFTVSIDLWLDKGNGSCLLGTPKVRGFLEKALMMSQGVAVTHHCWVIMPNHVHTLFSPNAPMPELIKAWKRSTAKAIGGGSLWQAGYYDTLIRSDAHYLRVVHYIRANPSHLDPRSYTLWESDPVAEIP